MPAYDFKSEFALLVEQGTKRCTIRLSRKRPTVPGDLLSLYNGQRTSHSRLLGRHLCVSVESLEITPDGVVLLSGAPLSRDQLHDLARADGFTGAWQFLEFFKLQYGLPFVGGELIRW